MDQEFMKGNPDFREAQTFEQTPAAIEVIKEQQFQITSLMNEVSKLREELSKSKANTDLLLSKMDDLERYYEEKLSENHRICEDYKKKCIDLDNAIWDGCILRAQLKVESMRNSDIMDSLNHDAIDSFNSMLEHTRQIMTDIQVVMKTVSCRQDDIKTLKSHTHTTYGGE